ncbi:phosphatidylserine decarboxylase [Evansella vedderi]|uniref:phosphatidylserine decarboxylase n=1 Tax=Evansella vedderi TaxID=38282 RepID=A0ABT9ZSV0_9BACI|nr:phosphatidylserine decarboxylase [Evansella vedderi]MDQ0254308.1 phosphatidylserine decarboxylase [Evansella vedderi]
MQKQLYRSMVELTRNPIYTSLLKSFATSRLSGKLNQSFAKAFGIDDSELEGSISDYKTLNDFFIRNLKEGTRPIAEGKDTIASPVDGLISQVGAINERATFHIKEQDYSLRNMLGLEKTVERYIGGTFILFYLSPKDYHRIHSPIDGEVTKRWALGKYSEPVNQWGLLLGQQPLANNYRLITEIENMGKRMAVVKVGALNVNSIHPTQVERRVIKGEEMAYFTFGSTVILLFEKDMIVQTVDVKGEGIPIKQGQAIGALM